MKGDEMSRPKGLKKEGKPEKPTHYKICCISLYTEDRERLGRLVRLLKDKGHSQATKSALIRFLLRKAEKEGLDDFPQNR